MTEHIQDYSDYFHADQRTKVELPLGGNRFFHEWAIVSSVNRDILTLQLSRDLLPHGVQLKNGEPLSVRAGSRGQGYRCRGVIEQDGSCENLAVKLTGPVMPDELRSYFRLNTSISMEYSPETPEQAWENPRKRCITGLGEENKGVVSTSAAKPAPFRTGKADAPAPNIINISGGGVRVELQEELQTGALLNLAFHLPHPQPELVPAVAEVVYCQPSDWRPGLRYIAGLRYVRIHERNRDRIIKYVCSEEIKKIRSCNKEFHSLPVR